MEVSRYDILPWTDVIGTNNASNHGNDQHPQCLHGGSGLYLHCFRLNHLNPNNPICASTAAAAMEEVLPCRFPKKYMYCTYVRVCIMLLCDKTKQNIKRSLSSKTCSGQTKYKNNIMYVKSIQYAEEWKGRLFRR